MPDETIISASPFPLDARAPLVRPHVMLSETNVADMVMSLTEALARQSDTIAAQADQLVSLASINAQLTSKPTSL